VFALLRHSQPAIALSQSLFLRATTFYGNRGKLQVTSSQDTFSMALLIDTVVFSKAENKLSLTHDMHNTGDLYDLLPGGRTGTHTFPETPFELKDIWRPKGFAITASGGLRAFVPPAPVPPRP